MQKCASASTPFLSPISWGEDKTIKAPDPIAHAYATIGLRPGASARELKDQYRKLAKAWHPDRWANDAVNQAEAAQKMRAINAAYATLHRAQTAEGDAPPAPAPSHAHPPDHWSVSHRSMTDEELNAIVKAIGTESYVSRVLRTLAWLLPLGGAFVAIQPQRGLDRFVVPKTRDVAIASLLFATSMSVLLWQKWSAASDERPTDDREHLVSSLAAVPQRSHAGVRGVVLDGPVVLLQGKTRAPDAPTRSTITAASRT